MSNKYLLLGMELSLYSGKLRSYMKYKEIPFEEVTATLEIATKVIIPKTKVKYIPIIVTPDGKYIQDTKEIMDCLEQRFPKFPITPSSPKQRFADMLLEIFADEWLVLPAMHYRWSFPEQRKFLHMEFAKNMAPEARGNDELLLKLGGQFSSPFSGSLLHLGVTKETIPAIEESYLELLDYLNKHFQTHLHVFGEKPSLADFALMGPLYAHLFRDPIPGSIMKIQYPHVAEWVERTYGLRPYQATVTEDGKIITDYATKKENLKFLPNDEIPETLIPILRQMFEQQMPVIEDTAKLFTQWMKENPNKPIPRSIGLHNFSIKGRTGSRRVFPYILWMFQRAYDYYHSAEIGNSGRQQINELLSSIHPNAVDYFTKLDLSKCRVARVNNILVRETPSAKL